MEARGYYKQASEYALSLEGVEDPIIRGEAMKAASQAAAALVQLGGK